MSHKKAIIKLPFLLEFEDDDDIQLFHDNINIVSDISIKSQRINLEDLDLCPMEEVNWGIFYADELPDDEEIRKMLINAGCKEYEDIPEAEVLEDDEK